MTFYIDKRWKKRTNESSLQRKGLTLNGMADLLVSEGAQYAINLDGGGSSVMVAAAAQQNQTHHHHAVVVSRPTCLDLPFPTCERPVASVVCIRHSSNNNIRQRQQQQQQQY